MGDEDWILNEDLCDRGELLRERRRDHYSHNLPFDTEFLLKEDPADRGEIMRQRVEEYINKDLSKD